VPEQSVGCLLRSARSTISALTGLETRIRMPAIEIIVQKLIGPEPEADELHYVWVQAQDSKPVLLMGLANEWVYIRPDGRVAAAPTQREAAIAALGFDLPNWRA